MAGGGYRAGAGRPKGVKKVVMLPPATPEAAPAADMTNENSELFIGKGVGRLQVTSYRPAGEAGRPFAAEFGITDTAINTQISSQTKLIKSVYNQIVESDNALK